MFRLKNGRHVALRHHALPDGGFVATHEDVTERRQMEERLAHMAHHDVLTGLPNRALFHEQLDRELRLAERRGGGVALLCLDLDDFKSIQRYARPSGRRPPC